MQINLRHPKEIFHQANSSITLDCEQCSILTYHGKPSFKVSLCDLSCPCLNSPCSIEHASVRAQRYDEGQFRYGLH